LQPPAQLTVHVDGADTRCWPVIGPSLTYAADQTERVRDPFTYCLTNLRELFERRLAAMISERLPSIREIHIEFDLLELEFFFDGQRSRASFRVVISDKDCNPLACIDDEVHGEQDFAGKYPNRSWDDHNREAERLEGRLFARVDSILMNSLSGGKRPTCDAAAPASFGSQAQR
jgi:hypothetical protein